MICLAEAERQAKHDVASDFSDNGVRERVCVGETAVKHLRIRPLPHIGAGETLAPDDADRITDNTEFPRDNIAEAIKRPPPLALQAGDELGTRRSFRRCKLAIARGIEGACRLMRPIRSEEQP